MWLYYLLIIYLLVSAILVFSIRKRKTAKLLYIIVSMGLLAILSMFRSVNVGNDTDVYARLFYNIASSPDLLPFLARYEMGYVYLNKFLANVSDHHQIVFIVTSVYIYFVFGRFIYKHSNMIWLSVFLFFMLGYFDLSMNRLREMLAIATILLSYDFIVAKKPVKFFLTVVAATMFHTAAIAFFAAYPLSKLHLSKKLVTIIFSLAVIGFVLFNLILNHLIMLFPRYSYYLDGEYLDGQSKSGTAILLFVNLVILIVSEICNRKFYYKELGSGRKQFKNYSVKSREDEIQSVFSLIACAILVIAFNGTIFKRFENIYGIFLIVYLPNSLKKLGNKETKFFVVWITVFLVLVYEIIIQTYRPEWQSIYPYSFF